MVLCSHPHVDQLSTRDTGLTTRQVVGSDGEGLNVVAWSRRVELLGPREDVLTAALVGVVVAIKGLVVRVS